MCVCVCGWVGVWVSECVWERERERERERANSLGTDGPFRSLKYSYAAAGLSLHLQISVILAAEEWCFRDLFSLPLQPQVFAASWPSGSPILLTHTFFFFYFFFQPVWLFVSVTSAELDCKPAASHPPDVLLSHFFHCMLPYSPRWCSCLLILCIIMKHDGFIIIIIIIIIMFYRLKQPAVCEVSKSSSTSNKIYKISSQNCIIVFSVVITLLITCYKIQPVTSSTFMSQY